MIEKLDKRNQRSVRTKLLSDDIYIIAHDALRRMRREGYTEFSSVELFLSARNFCESILALSDIEEGIDEEMDDLEEEVCNENDFVIIMTLVAVLLQAVGRRHDDIDIDIEKVSCRIFDRIDESELVIPLIKQMMKKEDAIWLEGRRIDLLTYELVNIEKDNVIADGNTIIANIVECASGLTPEGMQIVENVLSEVNDKYDHSFQEQLNILRQVRKNNTKAINNISGDFVLNKKVENEVGYVATGATGISVPNIKR